MSTTNDLSLLRPYYISKQWLHKLKYFGEPGPIDNSDFLCKHGYVYPQLWKSINSLAVMCTTDTWNYLVQSFGLKYDDSSVGSEPEVEQDELNESQDSTSSESVFTNTCNYLFPCKQCQIENEKMKERQFYEKSEFIRIREKRNAEQHANSMSPNSSYLSAPRLFAISGSWFKQWEQFVQFQYCPLKHQVPGKINNFPICVAQKPVQSAKAKSDPKTQKNTVYQLNKSKIYLVRKITVFQIL
jgi:ubiquitin carboxyl-terminal hydrolase 20/33